jgi:hypothetical protein
MRSGYLSACVMAAIDQRIRPTGDATGDRGPAAGRAGNRNLHHVR